jgi:iron complex outermembrane receptor protein
MEAGEVLFNNYENQFDAVNFAFGLAYELNQSKVKLNISSGFRAPNTSELLSNGVHEGTNQYVVGNSALESEAATQIDMAFDFNSTHFDFSFQPFYNNIKNYIYLSPSNTIIEGSPRFDYTQSDAILYGGELGFHYHPHQIHWLHLESDVSMVLAENGDGDPLPLIPANRWRSTAMAEWTNQFLNSVFITYQYTASQNRAGLFETSSPSYGLMDVGLSLSIHKNVTASLGVTNLFDTNYIDHLSRLKSLEVPNIGRNITAKVIWELD